MNKIMMTGANGRVGKELREYEVLPISDDVTDVSGVLDTVLREKPDIVVHLAAKSNVEFCERKENEDTVVATNLVGTVNVLNAAEQIGAKVVLLSSDHVFSGGKGFISKRGPYKETDTPRPVNFYGLSKLSAESLQEGYSNLYVVRTSYLFDWDRVGFDKDTVPPTYPDFIYRSFMYVPHFVSNLYMYLSMLETMPKLIHITGSMTVSWYAFMKSFLGKQVDKRNHDLEYDYAPRPKYGGLRSIYKLFPSYSFLNGVEQMLRDKK